MVEAGTDSSEEEESDDDLNLDFFSNAEFLGARGAQEKEKRVKYEESKNSLLAGGGSSSKTASALMLKEGSAFIEGGSSY